MIEKFPTIESVGCHDQDLFFRSIQSMWFENP